MYMDLTCLKTREKFLFYTLVMVHWNSIKLEKDSIFQTLTRPDSTPRLHVENIPFRKKDEK